MPTELTNIINLLNENLTVYLIIFIVLSYLLISLLTWSFIKSLKYLGISNIIVGIVVIVIRFLLNFITNILPDYINIAEVVLPTIVKPLLLSGISLIIVGIIMLIINYLIIKYKLKNKKED